ncbi:hypothetical protein GCM10028789_02990 [Sinomonas halotolerans]
MAEKPRTALPFIMAAAVAAGLARLVLRKVKEDREARAEPPHGARPPRPE